MPTYQNKYCSHCQKTKNTAKADLCPECGEKLKKGSWYALFYYVDESGVKKQKKLTGFERRTDAEAAERTFLFNHQNEEIKKPDVKDLLFDDLYKEYYEYCSHRQQQHTLYDISGRFTHHVLPYFSGRKIGSITKRDIFNFQEDLNRKTYGKHNKPYAHKTKCGIRETLYSFYQYLYDKYDIPNVVDQVRGFRSNEERKEMRIWSREQFERALAQIDSPEYRALFLFFYWTGARLGEVQALTWKDIDFKNKTVTFNKTYVRHKTNGRGAYVKNSPKTDSSIRTIKLPDILIEQLKTYHDGHNGNFVFEKDGKPFPEQSIRNYLKVAEIKAGLPHLRVHDFRHSHASLIISITHDILLVSKRLGHSSIDITLKTYAHLMPNSESNLIDKINASAYSYY